MQSCPTLCESGGVPRFQRYVSIHVVKGRFRRGPPHVRCAALAVLAWRWSRQVVSVTTPSHLYNLRRSKTYRARRTTVDHTRTTAVRIGERRRPDPGGKPGYLRVDTVHQGDRNGVKGVYDINLIDEVTQFEHVGAVAGIAETFLVPVLEEMLVTLPFVVVGFHADNASRRDAPVPSTSTTWSRPCSTSSTSLIHKVAGAAFQRKRPGRGQERQRGAQVARPRPHPAALRAPGERLREGRALAVPQLPPSLPVRHRGPRRQGQGAPPVPPAGRRDALREAQVAARRRCSAVTSSSRSPSLALGQASAWPEIVDSEYDL